MNKPKYAQAQLRDMARIVKAAGEQQDERYLRFVMQLSLKVGCSPQHAITWINHLAAQ